MKMSKDDMSQGRRATPKTKVTDRARTQEKMTTGTARDRDSHLKLHPNPSLDAQKV